MENSEILPIAPNTPVQTEESFTLKNNSFCRFLFAMKCQTRANIWALKHTFRYVLYFNNSVYSLQKFFERTLLKTLLIIGLFPSFAY